MRDDLGPDLQRLLPVRVDVLRRVAAAEGVDHGHAHPAGRDDDLLQVIDDGLRGAPGRDAAGSDSSRAPEIAMFFSASAATISLRLRRREVGDIDVRGPGVAARRPGGLRPAGDLQRLEAGGRRPVGDLHQRRVRERRSQETELHVLLLCWLMAGSGRPSPIVPRASPLVAPTEAEDCSSAGPQATAIGVCLTGRSDPGDCLAGHQPGR